MTLPQTAQPQTASVKVPGKIKTTGITALLKKALVTNARTDGRGEDHLVDEDAREGEQGQVRIGEDQQGRQGHITTTGAAKKSYVKLSLKAPTAAGYQAYSDTKERTVK